MNIIISESLHNKLQKNIVSTIEFGSALKGESNEHSDHDYLHIVESVSWWTSSPIANQHLLQYKDGNADHIYCNAHTFVKSLLDGDTTIFVEMHKYGGLNNTCLEFLNKYNFVYYKTLRAYLGISRRDIKDIKKLWKNKDTESRKINKKFKFVQQGIDFVFEHLDNLINDKDLSSFYFKTKNDILGELTYFSIDEKTSYQELDCICEKYNNFLEYIRNKLNYFIESNLIEKVMSFDEFENLTKELNTISIINSMEDCRKDVMKCFYDSYIGEIQS